MTSLKSKDESLWSLIVGKLLGEGPLETLGRTIFASVWFDLSMLQWLSAIHRELFYKGKDMLDFKNC